ncbi:hypothetical protein HAX54_004203, partial [Datura stramonium]|nr:hypothetical protein [Datura stramonium]
QKNKGFRLGAGMTEGVTAHHTTDGGVDGRQPGNGPSPVLSRCTLQLEGDEVGATARQSCDSLSFGAEIWAILFKPDGGDEGPLGLRRSITCSVRRAATKKFHILKYFPRGSF